MTAAERELVDLLHRLSSGELTDEQFLKLDEQLQTQAGAGLYAEFMLIEAALGWESLQQTIGAPRVAEPRGWHQRAVALIKREPVLSVIAASLVLVLVIGLLAYLRLPLESLQITPSIEPGQIVAQIFSRRDCQWDGPAPNAELMQGQTLRLKSGVVAIRFNSGALTAMRGPAEFVLNTDAQLKLIEGQVIAQVPHEATGFTVSTTTVDVIDLGTEFSVRAAADETEVQVLVGKVKVQRNGKGNRPIARVLTAGKGALFGSSPRRGYYAETRATNHNAFAEVAPLLAAASSTPANGTTLGYWRFEEGVADAKPSVVWDRSGSGNHAKPLAADQLAYSSNVPSPHSRLSMCFAAQQAAQGFEVAPRPTLNATTGITLEAFVHPSTVSPIGANPEGAQCLIYKWDENNQSYAFRLDGDKLRFVLDGDGTGIRNIGLTGSQRLPADQWSHVAATWSASDNTMRLYVNGVADTNTAEFVGPIFAGSAPLEIGRSTSANVFQGLMDEVRISNVALTPDQFLHAD